MTVNYHHLALALRSADQDAMHVYSISVFGAHCDADGQNKSAIWIAPAKQRVLAEIKRAAAFLGFELVENESPATEPANFDWETMTVTPDNTTEVYHVTAPDDTLSTAGPHPQNGGPAPQDIDQLAPGFSHGLSGRAEQ